MCEANKTTQRIKIEPLWLTLRLCPPFSTLFFLSYFLDLILSRSVIIFGCVYLGSTSALNAILSSSVVLLQISYCVPVILLIVRGRHLLDTAAGPVLSQQPRTINLGRFGLPINLFGVLFAIFTSVFFCFPPELPVSGPNMNYVSVVIAIVFIISGLTYWIQGKKYTG